jgi:hypothetical protein
MKLIFLIVCGVWLLATVACALKLAKDADAVVDDLLRKNKRRHNLGKWLRFHRGIK